MLLANNWLEPFQFATGACFWCNVLIQRSRWNSRLWVPEIRHVCYAIFTAHNEVGARLCFYVSVILFTGGWGGIPACIAGGIPPCLAAALQRGIKACLAGFQAHTQGGSWGVWLGGFSRPTPGRSPGPHPGGLQAHTQGCVADLPMATAAGGMHPTGMHSCIINSIPLLHFGWSKTHRNEQSQNNSLGHWDVQ